MTETENIRVGMQKLWKLFITLFLVTFTNSVFLLVEKLFLARTSAQALQAAVSVAYICNISQTACIALAMMAQVTIGRLFGKQAYQRIGPSIWQYLWFSLLSPIVTIPISLLVGNYYFQEVDIRNLATPYFHLMIGINFLHPLGAALACFFSGRGKTRLLLLAAIGSQTLKIGGSYLLIFGKWGFPVLGLVGGAWGTLIAQGVFCLFLFSVFMNKKNRFYFNTSQWKFHWKLFQECIHPGFLRALNRVICFSCWATISKLMFAQGEDYALALSLGGTFFFFLPCLADALSQAQITIVSQAVGAGRHADLKLATKVGYLAAMMIGLLGVAPFLVFPEYTFKTLFPTLTTNPEFIEQLLFGIFFSFVWLMISSISISPILAFRDMRFSLFMGLVNWVNGYLLVLFSLKVVKISAGNFWLALSLMHASTALLYHLRANYLAKRFEKSLTIPSAA